MGVHGHGHQLEEHGRDTLHPEGKVGHPHQPKNIIMFRLELEPPNMGIEGHFV